MKKNKKNLVSRIWTVALVLVLALTMTGCGSKGGKNKADQEKMKELVYKAEQLPCMDQVKGDINSLVVQDDTIYLYTSEWIEGEAPAVDMPATDDAEGVATDDNDAADASEPAAAGARDKEDDEADDADADNDAANDDDAADQAEDDAAATDDGAADTDTDKADDDTADTDDADTDGAEAEIDLEEPVEEFTYTTNLYFYKMKFDGSELTTLMEKLDVGQQNEWLNSFCVDNSGDIEMLYSSYDPKQEVYTFIIRILDGNGKEKKSFNLTDMINNPDTYIQSIVVDNDNDIYLLADQEIYVIDKEGAELCNIKMDGWANNLTKMNDGTVIISTYGEKGMELKEVDKKAKGFGKTYELEQGYGINQIYAGCGDYSFYYNDSSYLYGYDVNTGKATEILNWVSSNIGANNINNLSAAPDGSFLCAYYDNTMGEEVEYTIYRLTKVDPSEVADKTIITYAGTYVDDAIKMQAVKFNKNQDNYQIIIKDYSSSDDPTKDMNADLLAGDIPDILDLSNLNTKRYIAKGMLLDLYPLMEKDPDINKEDFQENILKLMESDGKLCHITPAFGINALVGRKKDLGDGKTFTIDDIIALEEKYGNGAKAFHMTSNTSALSQVLYSDLDRYVDWSTGKCDFDSEDFIKLLEYANTYPKDEEINWDEGYVSLPTAIREKQVLFATVWSLSMEEMQLYKGMFQEDVTFVGFPSNGATGPAVTMNNDIGIYAKTACPEGAWAFLKTFLTEEFLEGKGNYYYYNSLPLRKDAFEDEVKKYTTTEVYTDKFGNEVHPVDSSWGYDDVEVQIGPLSDEQVSMLRDVVASADHLYNSDMEVMNIITEESGAFFSGQKPAKEVAGIIQNRVSTYVNENR